MGVAEVDAMMLTRELDEREREVKAGRVGV